MHSCSFISHLVLAGILCVSVADLDHFMMLMWHERTPVSSGRLKGAPGSCPLMRTEKSSSWGKAVRQNDLRSVFVESCSSSRNTLSHQAYVTAVFTYRHKDIKSSITHCFSVALCSTLGHSIWLGPPTWRQGLPLLQKLHVGVMSHLLFSPVVCPCVSRYRCSTHLETDAWEMESRDPKLGHFCDGWCQELCPQAQIKRSV